MPTELDGYQNILGDYLVWLNDKLNIDRRAWLDDAHGGTHQIPTGVGVVGDSEHIHIHPSERIKDAIFFDRHHSEHPGKFSALFG